MNNQEIGDSEKGRRFLEEKLFLIKGALGIEAVTQGGGGEPGGLRMLKKKFQNLFLRPLVTA